jgi:uncharacterized protein involved in exopolysaccharide biosynthesis
VNILDYYRLAWRSRAMILGITAIAVIVALVGVTLQKKVYAARATVLAPKETSSHGLSASLGALLGAGGGGERGGGITALLASGPSIATNTDMFAAILRSRTLRQEVVAELAKTHGPDVGTKILGADVNLNQKGVIGLDVESTDPQVAADTANLYFQTLDRVLERLAEQTTKRQQAFYADQLQRAAREMAFAEEAVLKFQTENHVVSLDSGGRGDSSSARSAVDASAGLRGSIMAAELQREVLRMRLTDQHPQMRELDKQIAELKKQYSKNLFGAPMDLPGEGPSGQRRKEFFVSTEKMTPVQFAYLKLYRNLKIQEAFYTGALQGLEQFKYNDGTHQVRVEPLDPAVPTPIATRPRRLFTVLAAAVAGLLTAICLVYVVEYVRRLLAEERAMRMRGRLGERRAEALESLTPPDDFLMQPDPLGAAGRTRQ